MAGERYLRLAEIVRLHQRIVARSGGAAAFRVLGALEAGAAQPRATFDGADLYVGLAAKGAALVYALVLNHPFVDGNKRIGHAALEAFLMLNGKQLDATVDDAERCFLDLAAGSLSRELLRAWIEAHLVDR